MKKLAGIAASLALCGGCAWNPAAELEQRRIDAEIEQLGQIKGLLGSGPQVLATDFQLFLSKLALNDALKQLGSIETPLEGAGDAVLKVGNVRIAFSNGYPELAMDASVRSDKRRLQVDVATRAVMFLDVTPGKLDNSRLRVVIQELAPRMTLPFYEFELKGFWKDVARAAAQDQLRNLPAFSVPLSATMPASFGGEPLAMTIPTGNGSTVTGSLSIPAVSSNITIELKHVLFLEDGVHFYLDTKVTS